MSEMTEYFTRHYFLVLNNQQDTYESARVLIRAVLRNSGITYAEWSDMDTSERSKEFASKIGDEILSLVRGNVDRVLDGKPSTDTGVMLINETMRFGGGDLAYALGERFMPEDDDAVQWLPSDDE